jgi:hypothetical protein
VENIAGYVYDHTGCDERRWHQLEADQRGPYFVSAVNGPRRDEFLKSVRSQIEKKTCCDPLDGQVHSLEDVTRWIGIRELALRFIGLGVILGVFQLVEQWKRREEEKHDDMIKRLQREHGARFRSKAPQGSSIDLIDTQVDSRSRRAENCKPIIITSSAEFAWATLPGSSATTSATHRPFGRSARRFTCRDAWPTARSDRPRRG